MPNFLHAQSYLAPLALRVPRYVHVRPSTECGTLLHTPPPLPARLRRGRIYGAERKGILEGFHCGLSLD